MAENLDWAPIAAWAFLALSFVFAGVGTVLPGIPGAAFVLVALLVHHWVLPDFYPLWTLWLVGALALLSWLADFTATALGAKWGGASQWGLLGAAVGGFLGLFFGPPGLLVGPFLGAVLADLWVRGPEWRRLFKAGAGAALGVVLAMALRLALLMVMAGVLLGTALWRLAAPH